MLYTYRATTNALAAVTHQVGALGQTSATTITEANALAARLAQQSQVLASAVKELGRNNEAMDSTLDARRHALESLLETMHVKTGDFDSMMQSFAGLLNDSFKQAEARARDIGTYLAETTQSTAGAITTQFETIRSTTGKDRAYGSGDARRL